MSGCQGKHGEILSQAEIQEYWVLDLQKEKLIVFRQPEGSEYLVKTEVTEGTIRPLAFSKVEVSVTKLLRGA